MLRNACRAASRLIHLFRWSLNRYLSSARHNRAEGSEGIKNAAERTRLWAEGCLKIIGFELRVHGEINHVRGGLVVSNHQGFMDIGVHAAIFPLRFTPKVEMKSWPLIGALTAQNRPIWIDRKKRSAAAEVANEIARTMAHGISLIVYPEGTTTDGLHGLLPFKSTPFESVLEARLPIQPILTVFHSSSADPAALAWYGDAKLLPGLWYVLGLEKLGADVYIMKEIIPEPGENRKTLAARVHRLMEDEYWRIQNHAKI